MLILFVLPLACTMCEINTHDTKPVIMFDYSKVLYVHRSPDYNEFAVLSVVKIVCDLNRDLDLDLNHLLISRFRFRFK